MTDDLASNHGRTLTLSRKEIMGRNLKSCTWYIWLSFTATTGAPESCWKCSCVWRRHDWYYRRNESSILMKQCEIAHLAGQGTEFCANLSRSIWPVTVSFLDELNCRWHHSIQIYRRPAFIACKIAEHQNMKWAIEASIHSVCRRTAQRLQVAAESWYSGASAQCCLLNELERLHCFRQRTDVWISPTHSDGSIPRCSWRCS